MNRRTLAAAALGVALLAGCGGDEDLSVAAEQVLAQDVEAIATAARAGDAARLQELVLQLRGHVEEYEDRGEVSERRAAEILAAAARVATDVGPPAPEVVVSAVPAPPAPSAPGKGEGTDGEEGEQGRDEDEEKGSEDKGSEDKGKGDDGKQGKDD